MNHKINWNFELNIFDWICRRLGTPQKGIRPQWRKFKFAFGFNKPGKKLQAYQTKREPYWYLGEIRLKIIFKKMIAGYWFVAKLRGCRRGKIQKNNFNWMQIFFSFPIESQASEIKERRKKGCLIVWIWCTTWEVLGSTCRLIIYGKDKAVIL